MHFTPGAHRGGFSPWGKGRGVISLVLCYNEGQNKGRAPGPPKDEGEKAPFLCIFSGWIFIQEGVSLWKRPHFRGNHRHPQVFPPGPDTGLRPGLPLASGRPTGPGVGRRRKRPVPAAGGPGGDLGPVCSQEELEEFWSGYFDLETDYEEKRRALSGMSPALAQAAAFAPGIRILRQDPWEALCSFLISKTYHIPRIKGIIERLCQLLGEPIGDTGWHSFPGPEKLSACSLEDLAPLRAGFRAKYLLDAARKVAAGEVDLDRVARSPWKRAVRSCKRSTGWGPRWRKCALLYGFHKTECFPLDVWMKRAMALLSPARTPKPLAATPAWPSSTCSTTAAFTTSGGGRCAVGEFVVPPGLACWVGEFGAAHAPAGETGVGFL